jgi:hypothetical protein
VSGGRIDVEPIGTPVGRLDGLFGGSDGGTEVTVPPTTAWTHQIREAATAADRRCTDG